jgi:hypothetical protein
MHIPYANFSIGSETVTADEMTTQPAAATTLGTGIALGRSANELLRLRNAEDGPGLSASAGCRAVAGNSPSGLPRSPHSRERLAQLARHLGGPVGQDDVRPGPADGRQCLHDRAIPVQPPVRRRSLVPGAGMDQVARCMAAGIARGEAVRASHPAAPRSAYLQTLPFQV